MTQCFLIMFRTHPDNAFQELCECKTFAEANQNVAIWTSEDKLFGRSDYRYVVIPLERPERRARIAAQ